jgi:ferredoxin
MQGEEQVYRNLQKHLDKQAVGYPATESGVELRILERFFNPDEARLATHLSYKPRSLDHIYETAKEMGMSLNDIEKMLDVMMKNGVIGRAEREGVRYFYNTPFVVGMYEGQVKKLTPELLKDVEEYTSKAFGLEFLSTELPQMRTIPVRESIPLDYHVTNYEHLADIINGTDGPIAIMECICRQKAAMMGNPCQKTTRMEACMAFGDTAKNCISSGTGRAIGKEEALEISRQNESDGLVLQPSNTQKVEFVCACCGCCCGILRMHKKLPKPVDLWAANYYVAVNPDNCTGCGTCVARCQVNAISIDKGRNVSRVNLDRCIGCGNCITTCPSGAASLLKKEEETIPPLDSENLYDIIMANKKGKLDKVKLAAKLMPKK